MSLQLLSLMQEGMKERGEMCSRHHEEGGDELL